MNKMHNIAMLNLSGFLLPFINFGVFVGAGVIYFIAVLWQYGRTGKGDWS